MGEVEIRGLADADRTELMALFGQAGEGAPTASLWGHAESEAAVYLTPYLDLEPAVPGLRYQGRRVHQLTMVRPGSGTDSSM
ncbi:hypothetical protein [Pseudonocardia sp. DSM 110487]|uniref:hypothetical protein n=1 Tax=Pseudonocardia sp. DSM 110487 TaxID=2865833 RepID=UPI002104BE10|nr:hypothetical protein [Pseudonocardia sp. DSM 110487]